MVRATTAARTALLALAVGGAWSWAIGHDGSIDVFFGEDGPNGTLDRWALPENMSTAESLGAGISWAWDPQLCDKLMPLFPEETQLQAYASVFFDMPKFIDCDLIKRMMQRAMASWAAANHNIRFFEVTTRCTESYAANYVPPKFINLTTTPPFAPPSSPSPPMIPPCPYPPPPTLPPAMPSWFTLNESMLPRPPPPPPDPTPCELGLESCWSCEPAELEIKFHSPERVEIVEYFPPPSVPPEYLLQEPSPPPGVAPPPFPPPDLSNVTVANVTEYVEPNFGYAPSAKLTFVNNSGYAPRIARRDYEKGGWQDGYPETGIWVNGFPELVFAEGGTLRKAVLELNVADYHCYWVDEGWCVYFFDVKAKGYDIVLWVDVVYYFCFAVSAFLVAYKGFFELYGVLQTTLLSWDTDGDGVVEFHEVVGALKAVGKIVWSRVRHCRKSKDGFGGRTIEWRSALYGILDVLAKADALVWITTLFLMFYPYAFREAIFRPCWECDDLEAVFAKQIGAVLGLSPDAPSALNPGNFFVTDQSIGYNCSEPLHGVTKVDPPTVASLMKQETRRASPRLRCPTADDADGLRYLYPECDMKTECEATINSTGCDTFTGFYSCEDAFGCTEDDYSYSYGGEGGSYDDATVSDARRLSEATPTSPPTPASPAPAPPAAAQTPTPTPSPAAEDGTPASFMSLREPEWTRPVPHVRCTSFGEHDSTSTFRTLLLAIQLLLLQVLVIVGSKYMAKGCLRLPFLKETRKRNVKLQEMANLRKAEVRRMGEKGQNFVVKQAAKSGGLVTADEAVKMLTKVKDGQQGSALKDKTAEGLKGFAARAKGAGNGAGKTSATSLLMKGVAAADAEREKEAKAKEARMKAKLAITGGKQPDEAGPSSDKSQSKKLSFGEYMSRAGESSPASRGESTLARRVGERTETVKHMVAQGVTIKRGPSSATIGPSPTPGRLQPSPSFANDVKMLTAAVHQRSSAQLNAAGPLSPTRGGQASPTRAAQIAGQIAGQMSPTRAGCLSPSGASRTRVSPSPGAGGVNFDIGE